MFLANGRVTAHAAEISGHERIRCRACAWHRPLFGMLLRQIEGCTYLV